MPGGLTGVEIAKGVGPGTSAPASPSGFDVPTGNIAGFTLVYVEDFNRPVSEGPVTTDGSPAPFDTLYGIQAHNDLAGGIPISISTYPSTFDDTSNRGRYGAAIVSVAANSSILRERIRYEAGWPRVFAMTPRLGNLIAGQPYGSSNVLGGAIELVWRSDVVNTYKFVPLLWPLSNHRQTASGVDADGEIDWPEANQFGGSKISGFMHWQGDVSTDSTTEQTSYTSPTVLADGNWHKTRTEWIPGIQSGAHPTRSTGGSVKWYLDDVLVRTITGSTDGVTGPFIPMNPMHWVIQQETHLGSAAIDQTATGFLDIDWMAFYKYP